MSSIELTKKYWESITLNSQVNLSDTAALEASQSEGRGLQGMEYSVKEITVITEKDYFCKRPGLCRWILLKLVHPNQVLYLCAKIIGDDVELRMYYNPESIIVGNREEQVNAQNVFMFENYEPHCLNDLLGLRYAKQINWTFDFGNGPEEVIFSQKGGIELQGEAIHIASDFSSNNMATVSEYLAETETPESEIMIVEIGPFPASGHSGYSPELSKIKDSKRGGEILFLVGNMVNEFEISIVRKS